MKKKCCGILFFLISLLPIFSAAFPEKLSDSAKISILSVSYTDASHSLFSKNCLRFYDKDAGFNQIIDFAYFENFDDEFFLLKFFIHGKKAHIRSEPFFEYFLEQSQKTNVSLIESIMELSTQEIAYIFSFVRKLHQSLPEYEYDFDILTNNSETHISRILHDAARMSGCVSDMYSFSEISKHKLNYKLINDSYILSSEKENFDLQRQYIFKAFEKKYFKLTVVLFIFSALIFLCTAYQMLAYFFEKLFVMPIFQTIQICDFLILFLSGLSGSVILFQDIFSNQTMFRNNPQFLYLFPCHLIASFTIFKPIQNRKMQIYYWIFTTFVSFLYIVVRSFVDKKLPLVSFLIALPIFLRTLYFYFVVKDVKTDHSFLPYTLLRKFADWISS